jgi:hypothetical protein
LSTAPELAQRVPHFHRRLHSRLIFAARTTSVGLASSSTSSHRHGKPGGCKSNPGKTCNPQPSQASILVCVGAIRSRKSANPHVSPGGTMAGTTLRRVAEEDGGGAGSVGSEQSAHCGREVAVGAIMAKLHHRFSFHRRKARPAHTTLRIGRQSAGCRVEAGRGNALARGRSRFWVVVTWPIVGGATTIGLRQ